MVSFYGSYPEAEQPHWILQRLAPAITWGQSKDHRPDFVYVADCKLATTDNMNAIARQGGRFISNLTARSDDGMNPAGWLDVGWGRLDMMDC